MVYGAITSTGPTLLHWLHMQHIDGSSSVMLHDVAPGPVEYLTHPDHTPAPSSVVT